MSKHNNMFVRCPSCGDVHYTEDMEPYNVLGIHEGSQGEDVLEYHCPHTGKPVESTVYRSR